MMAERTRAGPRRDQDSVELMNLRLSPILKKIKRKEVEEWIAEFRAYKREHRSRSTLLTAYECIDDEPQKMLEALAEDEPERLDKMKVDDDVCLDYLATAVGIRKPKNIDQINKARKKLTMENCTLEDLWELRMNYLTLNVRANEIEITGWRERVSTKEAFLKALHPEVRMMSEITVACVQVMSFSEMITQITEELTTYLDIKEYNARIDQKRRAMPEHKGTGTFGVRGKSGVDKKVGTKRPVICFRCKKEGHNSIACPEKEGVSRNDARKKDRKRCGRDLLPV